MNRRIRHILILAAWLGVLLGGYLSALGCVLPAGFVAVSQSQVIAVAFEQDRDSNIGYDEFLPAGALYDWDSPNVTTYGRIAPTVKNWASFAYDGAPVPPCPVVISSRTAPLAAGKFLAAEGEMKLLPQFSEGNAAQIAPVPAPANPIARITPGSLPAAEEALLNRTLGYIDTGTTPTGPLATKWGTPFKNWPGAGGVPRLRGSSGAASPYLEYRVAPVPGTSGAGPLRVVVNQQTGEMYYTWTHCGNKADPAFVIIR